MKKFIHARERGFISYENETASQSFQIAGTGYQSSVYFSHDFTSAGDDAANTTDAQNRLRVTVTSAAANTSNRGDDYTNNNTEIGTITVLEDEALTMVGNNLVIKNTTQDPDHGYNIKANDLVEITDCFKANTGELMVDASRLVGITRLSNTSTVLRFKSIKYSEGSVPVGAAGDDGIQLVYDNTGDVGLATHKKICKFIESFVNGYNASDNGLLTLDFSVGGSWPRELSDVFHINVTKQS